VPIGPAFVHGGVVQVVAVHPDSMMAATGSRDQTAIVWNAPGPRVGSPEPLTHWAQLVTGLRLEESGALRVVTASEWQQLQRLPK